MLWQLTEKQKLYLKCFQSIRISHDFLFMKEVLFRLFLETDPNKLGFFSFFVKKIIAETPSVEKFFETINKELTAYLNTKSSDVTVSLFSPSMQEKENEIYFILMLLSTWFPNQMKKLDSKIQQKLPVLFSYENILKQVNSEDKLVTRYVNEIEVLTCFINNSKWLPAAQQVALFDKIISYLHYYNNTALTKDELYNCRKFVDALPAFELTAHHRLKEKSVL